MENNISKTIEQKGTINNTVRTLKKGAAHQKGLSIPEVLIGLFILALIYFAVFESGGGASTDTLISKASTQLLTIKNAGDLYRASNNGSYNGASVTNFAGFNIKPFTDGVSQSAFGTTITAAASNSDADLTITLATPGSFECEGVLKRVQTMAGLTTPAPTCSAANLLTAVFD